MVLRVISLLQLLHHILLKLDLIFLQCFQLEVLLFYQILYFFILFCGWLIRFGCCACPNSWTCAYLLLSCLFQSPQLLLDSFVLVAELTYLLLSFCYNNWQITVSHIAFNIIKLFLRVHRISYKIWNVAFEIQHLVQNSAQSVDIISSLLDSFLILSVFLLQIFEIVFKLLNNSLNLNDFFYLFIDFLFLFIVVARSTE